MPVFAGRYTAALEPPFVVFIIGMRVNNILAVHHWLPTFNAMPKMLSELGAQPELGLLSGEFMLMWRGAALVQYWRSFDALEAYARNVTNAHLPAWTLFNKRLRGFSAVGVFHETYVVGAGDYEAIYVNMPRFGLGGAGTHEPITAPTDRARLRKEKESTAGL